MHSKRSSGTWSDRTRWTSNTSGSTCTGTPTSAGLTHAKKIAGLSEAHYATVVPHSQDSGEQGRELVEQPLERDGGYLQIPDRPGIGVELDDDAIANNPCEPREAVTRLHEDGSVVDQ